MWYYHTSMETLTTVDRMELDFTGSSCLRRGVYRPLSGMLYISFVGPVGRPDPAYIYSDVPSWVVQALLGATSRGSFFMQNIAHSYPYRKM